MTRFALLAVAAAAALAPTAASAQYNSTRADRLACTGDALRMCRSHIHEIGGLRGCMNAHKAHLSPACRAVVERK